MGGQEKLKQRGTEEGTAVKQRQCSKEGGERIETVK